MPSYAPPNDPPPERSGLLALAQIVRRRKFSVLACVLLLPAVVVLISLSQPKRYTGTSHLLFRNARLDERFFGSNGAASPQPDPQRQAATNLRLVDLRAAAERTAAQFPGLSPSTIRDTISAAPEGDSDLVAVSAVDRDPRRAADVANAFAQQLIAARRRADVSIIDRARNAVLAELASLPSTPRTAAQRRLLGARADQLRTFSALQTGNAELAQSADVPRSPSSPTPVRNAIIAALLAFVLGLALAVLRERFDRRIRDVEELAPIYHRPLLGAIPLARARLGVGVREPLALGTLAAEAFQLLRVNLFNFQGGRDVKVIVLTSAEPRDGKTTVAWNLAAAAAIAGSRALIIEGDLRRPSIAQRYLPDPKPPGGRGGLSEVLLGNLSFGDAKVSVPVGKGLPNAEPPGEQEPGVVRAELDVIVAGGLPPNPNDLIESAAMRRIIAQARPQYDVIVIDSTPPTLISDAVALGRLADGILVVSRIGKTRRDVSRRLATQLENLDFTVLGVVANCLPARADGYGYGYGYGYGSRQENGRAERSPAATASPAQMPPNG